MGVDEVTVPLLKDKKQFAVVGTGKVTLLRIVGGQEQITILNPGDTYTMP